MSCHRSLTRHDFLAETPAYISTAVAVGKLSLLISNDVRTRYSRTICWCINVCLSVSAISVHWRCPTLRFLSQFIFLCQGIVLSLLILGVHFPVVYRRFFSGGSNRKTASQLQQSARPTTLATVETPDPFKVLSVTGLTTVFLFIDGCKFFGTVSSHTKLVFFSCCCIECIPHFGLSIGTSGCCCCDDTLRISKFSVAFSALSGSFHLPPYHRCFGND